MKTANKIKDQGDSGSGKMGLYSYNIDYRKGVRCNEKERKIRKLSHLQLLQKE